MTELIKYEAARRALAEAKDLGEVKTIRDKAIAMKEFARRAKDRELLQDAIEMRFLAELEAGQRLIEMARTGQRKKSGGQKNAPEGILLELKDLDITAKQSHNWQQFASLSTLERQAKVE